MGRNVPIGRTGGVAYTKLNAVQLKAYSHYNGQISRCNSKKSADYKNYGGKGIKVKYTRCEFIEWYQEKIKYFRGKTATVGRIDHNKDYTLDNIEIQSMSDNSKERHRRNPHIRDRKKVGLFCKKTGMLLIIFQSTRHTAKYMGICRSTVSRQINGHSSGKSKWYYKVI